VLESFNGDSSEPVVVGGDGGALAPEGDMAIPSPETGVEAASGCGLLVFALLFP